MAIFRSMTWLLIMCPMLSLAQKAEFGESLRHRVTLRPVYGAGGESAVGLGLVGEYGYQLLRHGPILELALQVGGFGDTEAQPQEGRRNYTYQSLLAGAGINVGTGLRGRFFAKVGAGVAYHYGSETNEYQQQITTGGGTGTLQQVWLSADRHYREPVFNTNAEIGVRVSHRWEVSLKGTLFTNIGEGNALLLIGPGLSRRF